MPIDVKLVPGELYDFSRTTPGSQADVISNRHKADMIGAITSGAARIRVTPAGMPLGVRYLDLSVADGVIDLVHSEVDLNAGDEIELEIDPGTTGFVLVRLKSPRE
jgi:hypothetical protein